MPEPLSNVVEKGWAEALAPVEDQIAQMGAFLREQVAEGKTYLPAGENVLRAFQQPFDDVRVLIVGQDPYPTPGHAVGLSFSVAPTVKPIPASLVNIFKEYSDDLGYPKPENGDLTPWADRGILLLNRVLTVEPRKPGSHQRKGWEKVTEQAIRALAARPAPLAAILWGAQARKLAPLIGAERCIEAVHPSPMSPTYRNFFGTRPFSRANEMLKEQGGDPVDWRL
jgi:uracil-DNA glycosylase